MALLGNIAHVTCLVTLSQLSNTQDLDEKIKSGNCSLRQGSMTATLIPELENTSWLLPKQQLLGPKLLLVMDCVKLGN